MAAAARAGSRWIGLPQAILFQIVLAAISPIIDLALIVSFVTTWFAVQAHGWAQTQHDVDKMLLYWLIFTAIDLLAGVDRLRAGAAREVAAAVAADPAAHRLSPDHVLCRAEGDRPGAARPAASAGASCSGPGGSTAR